MTNKISLHEGEILRILIKRAGFRVEDAAPMLGLVTNSLSRIFKSEKLSKKVKANAVKILGVEESVFETGLGYEIPDVKDEVVGESELEYRTLMEENQRLKEENARMAEELLREKALSDDLRKVLVQITAQGGKDAPDDSMHFVSNYKVQGSKAQKRR